MSYRVEKKFRVTHYESLKIKKLLNEKGMKLLHPKRKITSQYFDTNNYLMFDESEEGVLPRKKVRARWYNDNKNIISFEEKVSSIEGRFKTTKKISYDQFLNLKKIGLMNKDYGRLKASAKISYEREYFEWNNIRFTFDTNITYSFNEKENSYNDFGEVVEIKAPYEISNDFIEKIFPITTSRFSKYCRAFLIKNKELF